MFGYKENDNNKIRWVATALMWLCLLAMSYSSYLDRREIEDTKAKVVELKRIVEVLLEELDNER